MASAIGTLSKALRTSVDHQHPAVVFLHRGFQFGEHLPDASPGPEPERVPQVDLLPKWLEGLVDGLADDAVHCDPDLQDPLLVGPRLGDRLLACLLGPPLLLQDRLGEFLGNLAEVRHADVPGRDAVDAGGRTALLHQLAEAVYEMVRVGDLPQRDLPAVLFAERFPPSLAPPLVVVLGRPASPSTGRYSGGVWYGSIGS